MKTTLLVLLALATLVNGSSSRAADSRVFELRTYHATPGKFEALHARFRDHTTALFAKHGIGVVGYWVPMDEDKGRADTLVYLLVYPSRAAADASWKAFQADPEWLRVRAESETNAGGSLTTTIQSVFLTATDYSPMK